MTHPGPHHIHVIDSHTGGEPTRVVIEGGPDLGGNSLAERRERFRAEFDHYRSAIVNEPRGSDPVVGALLCPPVDPAAVAAVIFFNNVGFINMCGHGTIGLVATLAHLGRIQPGVHRIETPVGTVTAELHPSGEVSVVNVPSYRHRKDVAVDVEGHGRVTGDVAWGGNWFFLTDDHGQALDLANADRLTDFASRIRLGLERAAITGRDGGMIDHIELFGPPHRPDADSRNFVLCPGGAYDRSPCGTGTSAKLACLIADDKIEVGRIWRQESITGSLFEAWADVESDVVLPTIRGAAFVNAEAMLILDARDPLCWGVR